MACIQPGISCVCMNAEDRNISGSMKNVYTPMIASRDLSSMPVMLDRAPNTTPTSIDGSSTCTASPRSWPLSPPGVPETTTRPRSTMASWLTSRSASSR